MINHSTNINKTQKWVSYGIGNVGPGLGQTHKCGRVKLVNGIPFDIWNFNDNTDNKQTIKNLQICF